MNALNPTPFPKPLVYLLALLLLLPVAFCPQTADAQLLKRIKSRVKRDAENRVEQRAVEAARAALDLAEDAIVCAVTDEKCIEEARKQGQEPVIVDKDGKPISGYEPAATTADASGPDGDQAGEGIWANYDFVPGDHVLFYHDFEGTRTGNFPSRIGYRHGNMEVVELGDNKVLRVGGESGGYGCVEIPVGQAFPERYTIEFRARTSDPLARSAWYLFSGEQETPRCRYPPKPHVSLTGYQGAGLIWDGGASTSATTKGLVKDEWAAVRISVDGPYWKVYVNERRVGNMPRFEFPAGTSFGLMFGSYRADTYVDDIRIAEGGPRSLYDDLMAEGFVSTTGILFDSGSAAIKPESTPTLNAVLEMLEGHEDLSLLIEGHTDSDGTEVLNQTLSEQRAASVKQYLVEHGIDTGQLEVVGYGESQPVGDNATPEAKAQNRRVVFRRQ